MQNRPGFFRRQPLPLVGIVGFTAGIPLSLTVGTIQAWLQTVGVDIRIIGLFALAGLPYTAKFLWSPLLDRYAPPFGGHRRGWISLSLSCLALVVALLGQTDPLGRLGTVATLTCLVAFLSANADIVIDAYRAELFPGRDQGPAASLHMTGYRIGMLFAGALALWLSDHLPWRLVFVIVAAAILPGAFAILLGPEPRPQPHPGSLREAVVQPFLEFMGRPRAWEMLAFIALFKLGDTLTTILFNPFLLQIGFTGTDIAVATRSVGILALLAGGLAGGWILKGMSLKAGLWFFGLLQAAGILFSYVLALSGRSRPLLYAALAVENGIFAAGSVAYLTLIAGMCNRRNTATQFALLTSISALTRVLLPSLAGFLVKALGWADFFLLACASSLPGLLLLLRFDAWDLPGARDAKAGEPA
jgi:PAT family beta-lactamase induction signal transducer AmpG